jgi:hypothetical protein
MYTFIDIDRECAFKDHLFALPVKMSVHRAGCSIEEV